MKKFVKITISLFTLSAIFAQNDLNLTFEDDSDLSNWSHHDEANAWTVEAWDATAGVNGTGGLVFTDGGYTFLVKRPVAATAGANYTVSIAVKTPNFGTGNPLNLSVQGLSSTEPSLDLTGGTDIFTTYTLSGVADSSTAGYIRLHSLGSTDAPTVTIDNLVYDDEATPTPNVTLYINEFMASNDTYMPDEYGDYDDWIEIYNGGSDSVDIGGMYITDDLTDPTSHQIPDTVSAITTIPPGGFLILWADKESEQGPLHVEVKLSGSGEQIGLYASDGTTDIDSLTFGGQSADTSYARTTDGGSTWAVDPTPTAGASNTSSNVVFQLNTSTGFGFTDSTSTLVLRGSMNGWSGNDWAMVNIGGDYWTYSAPLVDGTYEYKYVMIDDAGDHWESTDNRALTVSGDEVLAQDYWESGTTPPYTLTDSTDVWFRVSTAGISNYDGETMYIAGSMNGWSGEALTPEGDSTFWSGQYSFSSGTSIEYKFLHDTGGWESNDNRTATVTSDTTLAFVYWNNAPPTDLNPVNVTFNLNTSTAPGFTDSTNTLVIRGSMNGWAGNDWELTNVGGDYWSYTTTSPMVIADYEYKFVMVDDLGNDNWESTDNRLLSLANATTDVSIWLDYWENGQTPPYTPTDSTDVWFRVSTAGVVGYDGEVMHIAGTMNGWGAEPLTQEGESEFWSGQYSFSAAGASIEYKFLVDSDGWESIDNRTANVTSDTTLAFAYWDNAPPVDIDPVTKTVIFSVDMSEWLDEDGAEGIPLFSVARGDTMQVRGGFNGWNCDDPTDCVMSRTPGTNIFSLAVTLTDLPDRDNEYKFYLQHSAASLAQFVAEYGDMYGDMGWEDSPQYGGSNRIFQMGEDDGTGLLELPLSGYYDLPAGAVVPVDQAIALTFSVDMADTAANSFDAAEDTVFLVLKDKWLNYLQGFGDYSKHQATDNGDGTFSVTIDFMGPIPWHMIYTWGFYDVSEIVELEEGGGFGFGRFRARYFHSNSDWDCAWDDYAFPQDTWQADPPLPVEDYDPDAVCIALEVISDVVPAKFNLSDNYPNPFNPTTNISFSIPMSLDVQINIYNVLGQRVAMFNEGQLDAGTYNVRWNGRDQIGNTLASGIYFYELQAGDQFKQIKKMTLVK